MTQVTQDKALQRWDLLPLNLREALYLESNSEFLWKTCEGEHIPDEKIYTVSQVAGFVLMGFLHPEDVANELKKRLNLDQKTASAIEAALNKRIFAPLRADIDKVYEPVSKLEATNAPKIIQDIGPVPMATAQKMSGPLTVGSNFSKPIPPAPAPAEKGWSKASPNDPVIKLAPTQTPPPTPPAPASRPSFQPKPSTPTAIGGGGGEFERLSRAQNVPGAVPVPPTTPKPPSATSASASGPGPVMLHEVSQFKTIEGSADFHISMPSQNANVLDSSKGQPAAPKAAMIEMGKAKIVHYTDFKPPSPPQAQAQAGMPGRNVTEIKPAGFTSVPVPIPPPPKSAPAPVPPPPTIKQPSMPPATPPAAPGAPPPSGKVISKDYL